MQQSPPGCAAGEAVIARKAIQAMKLPGKAIMWRDHVHVSFHAQLQRKEVLAHGEKKKGRSRVDMMRGLA